MKLYATGSGMPFRNPLVFSLRRSLSSALPTWRPLTVLPDSSPSSFRDLAFVPSTPALLPPATFKGLPAVQKWFYPHPSKADQYDAVHDYLQSFGSATVLLEYSSSTNKFVRSHAPLSLFLEWVKHSTSETKDRLYLAQTSLEDLPQALRSDLPTPTLVTSSGRGDIYATNLWIGRPPTYTPLHRDPNPNLFVQLAGSKTVRLMDPSAGKSAFARVQASLGAAALTKFRGEEMMQGREREVLEEEVWGGGDGVEGGSRGFEAQLQAGDAVFIPNGWWHSIKGTGEGVTASVSWSASTELSK
ncbi:hypothetical protein MMC32_004673 [Xylographa parallela]|nr:hypothetical protein [Xylographa parallela]